MTQDATTPRPPAPGAVRPAPAGTISRRSRVADVVAVERVGERLVRLRLGGDDLHDFSAGVFTDHYLKLHLPPPGAALRPPFDLTDIRARLPRADWPVTRTYTVRHWDPTRHELTVDFVVHGDRGVAGPWASAARPGDRVQFSGPGGAYAPDVRAHWHLLAGDAAALPAIAVALARIPAAAEVHVFVEVEHPSDRQPLAGVADIRAQWVPADPDGLALARAIAATTLPAGRGQAFVHGEASAVREIKRELQERDVDMDLTSATGYWKRDNTEDEWQAAKRREATGA